MARATGRGRNAGRKSRAGREGQSRTRSGNASGRRSSTSTRSASASARARGSKTAQRRGAAASRSSRNPRAVSKRKSSSRARTVVTTDHDEIRRWAEERGAQPTCVRRTGGGGDIGMIRLDFPGYSGAESLEPISWADWFRKFDDSNLALLHQETTAGGQKSNFNKLIGRETAEKRQRGETRASRRHPERSTGSRRTGARSEKRESKSSSSRKKAA